MITLLSSFVAVLGVVVAVLGALTAGTWLAGIALSMDLWMAASLLRLSADNTWASLLTTASIIAIRKPVLSSLQWLNGRRRTTCGPS
jgi:hypothetical protein